MPCATYRPYALERHNDPRLGACWPTKGLDRDLSRETQAMEGPEDLSSPLATWHTTPKCLASGGHGAADVERGPLYGQQSLAR